MSPSPSNRTPATDPAADQVAVPPPGAATGTGTDAGPNADPGTGTERDAVRDIAEVPAVEVITAAAVHLMSAAAVKCGLAEDAEADLDEARKLITVLAALVTAAAPEIGSQHAAPLRDGLKSLQLAFREASVIPDAPGEGPGERWTGRVA